MNRWMKSWIWQLGSAGMVGLATASFAWAAIPRSSHEALTKDIQNSIEWSNHVIKEANQGAKLDVAHAKAELAHLKEWMEKMSRSYAHLSQQPRSETREGHFLAIQIHQKKAEALVDEFSRQLNHPKRNLRAMKKVAKNIRKELKAAATAHQLELKEMERE